ncbi:hypothetical protein, partial [Comamonas denitrificans]|uniref:hypothetical protein n=1 Tax=Comamonas denitrificans TaxID=117506 RepID=UPI003616F6B7
ARMFFCSWVLQFCKVLHFRFEVADNRENRTTSAHHQDLLYNGKKSSLSNNGAQASSTIAVYRCSLAGLTFLRGIYEHDGTHPAFNGR